ncbi:glycosyltransferase family 4 protein [Salibacterium aidingense]|uniref:glycosyltransferase family 4 protein n=1 Tax=Salibacterium aidingense TaxID=384933 RepID=UPI0003F812B2|nr:glycosyltransferase family 4 protein [Salibacterium aidingense]
MKVLHLPYGSPMIDLCRALRKKGIDAAACHFDENRFQFTPDICLRLNILSKVEREAYLHQYLKRAMKEYDIFHFHFGETFFPDKSDLKQLKQAGKKMVVHHHGSDVRMISIAKQNNPHVREKPGWSEEKIHHNLTVLSDYIDHAFVQDYELEPYIKKYYKQIHVIPHTIDTEQIKPHYPDPAQRVPKVVHAPTARDLKGTDAVLQAVNQLKQSGTTLDFQLIEGKSYKETLQLLSESDVVIDQLRIGASGFISSEAMALGKTVICYIRKDLESKYPSGSPIVNATPDTITEVLKEVVQNPQKRYDLGVKGRQYVVKHHSMEKTAEQYIDVYQQLKI